MSSRRARSTPIRTRSRFSRKPATCTATRPIGCPRTSAVSHATGDYTSNLDNERFMLVGGSATRWQGLTLRMLPNDFRTKSAVRLRPGLAARLLGSGAVLLPCRSAAGRIGDGRRQSLCTVTLQAISPAAVSSQLWRHSHRRETSRRRPRPPHDAAGEDAQRLRRTTGVPELRYVQCLSHRRSLFTDPPPRNRREHWPLHGTRERIRPSNRGGRLWAGPRGCLSEERLEDTGRASGRRDCRRRGCDRVSATADAVPERRTSRRTR